MKEELVRPELKEGPANLNFLREIINSSQEVSANDLRILHHMERYEFVAQKINEHFGTEPLNILDIGCGLGHGLAVMRQILTSHINANIYGLDIDDVAICNANSLYPDFNFICEDICDAELQQKFDVIIFFEVLGNENLKDDLEILTNFNNLLSENGLVFISIPSYRNKTPKSYFARLYDQKSFSTIIKEGFRNRQIIFYGQMHPVNRDFVLCDNCISEDLFENGDFMIAIIGSG